MEDRGDLSPQSLSLVDRSTPGGQVSPSNPGESNPVDQADSSNPDGQVDPSNPGGQIDPLNFGGSSPRVVQIQVVDLIHQTPMEAIPVVELNGTEWVHTSYASKLSID